MNKNFENKMNVLAEKHCSFIKGPCDFEQRIYKEGFKAAHNLMLEDMKKLIEILKGYGWVYTFGMTFSQALQEFEEKYGER
jgi:hypothetical protein